LALENARLFGDLKVELAERKLAQDELCLAHDELEMKYGREPRSSLMPKKS